MGHHDQSTKCNKGTPNGGKCAGVKTPVLVCTGCQCTHYTDGNKCHLCEGTRAYPPASSTTIFPPQKQAGIEVEQRYNTPAAFQGNPARHPKDQQTLDKAQKLRTEIQGLKALNDPELQKNITDREKQLEALQEPTSTPEEHDLAGLQARKAELHDKFNNK